MDTKGTLSKKTIAEITEEVGLLDAPPKLQIPKKKQWFPRFIAIGIQACLLPFVLLDQCAKKIARKIVPPPFERTGSCKKRGNCCYYITMRKRRGLFNRLQIFWMTQIHSFFLRENTSYPNGKHEYYLLGCSHLKEDGSCGNYRLRPIICRDWPLVELFGYPKILRGCGYWFAAKKKEYQHIVEEYNEVYEKTTSLPLLNDAVFYVDDPVTEGKDS